MLKFISEKGMADIDQVISEPACAESDRWNRLKAILLHDPTSVSLTSYCYSCGSYCTYASTDVVVAGTPCIDFSSWGNCAQEDGPTAPCLLVFIRHRYMLRERCIVLENVPRMTLVLVQELLSPPYDVSTAVLCPPKVGQPVERKRRYTICTLRGSVSLARPLGDFEDVFGVGRSDAFSMYDLMRASPQELQH